MDPMRESIGTFDHNGSMMTEKQVREERKRLGKCQTCGRKLFSRKYMRLQPLNVEGKVANGHCLRCESPSFSSSSQANISLNSPSGVFAMKKKKRASMMSVQSQPPLQQQRSQAPVRHTRSVVSRVQKTRNDRFSVYSNDTSVDQSLDDTLVTNGSSTVQTPRVIHPDDTPEGIFRLLANGDSDSELGAFVRESSDRNERRNSRGSPRQSRNLSVFSDITTSQEWSLGSEDWGRVCATIKETSKESDVALRVSQDGKRLSVGLRDNKSDSDILKVSASHVVEGGRDNSASPRRQLTRQRGVINKNESALRSSTTWNEVSSTSSSSSEDETNVTNDVHRPLVRRNIGRKISFRELDTGIGGQSVISGITSPMPSTNDIVETAEPECGFFEQCTSLSESAPLVVELMRETPSAAHFQTKACSCIRNLAGKEDSSEVITSVVMACVGAVTAAMLAHFQNEYLLCEALAALWSLSLISEESRRVVASFDGLISRIVSVIERFGSTEEDGNASLLQWAFGCLASLCVFKDGQKMLLKDESGAFETTLAKAIANKSSAVQVQGFLCQCVAAICSTSKEFCERFRKAGLARTILATAKKESEDSTVQVWCLETLRIISESQHFPQQQEKSRCDCMEEIEQMALSCMEAHLSNERCLEAAGMILADLGSGGMDAFSFSDESVLIRVFCQAMRSFPKSLSIHESGARILFHLVDTTIERMQTHSEDLSIQTNGCNLLFQISEQANVEWEGCADKIVSVVIAALDKYGGTSEQCMEKGLGFLVNVSRSVGCNLQQDLLCSENVCGLVCGTLKSSSHAKVQEKACELLSRISTVKSGRAALAALNVIGALMKVMRDNYGNRQLQCAALLTLRNLCVENMKRLITPMGQALTTVVKVMQCHPHHADVLTEAAGCLWAYFSSSAGSVYDAAFIASVIHATLNGMRNCGDSASVQFEGISVLYHCASDETSCGAISESGGTEVIINAMENHRSIELHENACCLLSNLSSHGFMAKSKIFNCGGVDALICSMLDFVESADLQLAACTALSNVAVDSDALLAIGSQGGIPVLMNSVSAHKDILPIQETACGVLFRLIYECLDTMLSASETVAFITKQMKEYPQSQSIQENGIQALANLCYKNAISKEDVVASNVIELITKCMKEHLSSAYLQKQASVTLWCLAMDRDHQQSILERGGLFAILDAMLAHMMVEEVQDKACGALMTMASNPDCRSVIRESDGVVITTLAMRVHFHSPAVLKRACSVLANLAVRTTESEDVFLTTEELQAIVSSMLVHPEDADVQQSACLALWNYSLLSCNASILKGAEELVHVLSSAGVRFPNECGERVQQLLCAMEN